jgi:hypothetical protein
MSKKVILIALILVVVSSMGVFASNGFGIGLEGVFSFAGGSPLGGFALTVSPPKIPIMIGASWNFVSPGGNLGFTIDWWLLQRVIAAPFGIYAGPGIGLGVWGLGGTADFFLGLRVPIGLQLFVLDFIEFFLELAPGIHILPGLNFWFQGALGVRFWF